MKKIISIVTFIFCTISVQAQRNNATAPYERPKLVVGIVVDQMRYEYLNRFWNQYGNGGFKRLIAQGFSCKNNHFNYIPTYTGPGHTSVYTGTTPRVHGIIANDWYDKDIDKMVYCAQDDHVQSTGTINKEDKDGKMSPNRMKTSTMGDALKLSTQQRSKVIGIALKDRGAILPAGHSANAAYWFKGDNEGNWITSSYYMNDLPQWVKTFNQSRVVDQYKKDWNTLRDISTYKESRTDINNFEGLFKGESNSGFPHQLEKIWNDNKQYSILKATPYGNSLTADFAMAAIEGEQLGQHADTDFLAVSFSSTDYVGHQFGVNSKEIEDTYIRLDKDLERFLNFLDAKVGKGNYTLFLTADHGASYVGSYLKSLKIPADYFDYKTFKKDLDQYAQSKYGISNLVKNISNNQVYFDYEAIQKTGKTVEEIENDFAQWILNYKDVDEVYTSSQMRTNNYTHDIPYLLQKGFSHRRSGNLLIVLMNDVVSYSKTGSTHGSGFSYDTQVPLLFYGKGIKKGETYRRTEIPDIAPTITSLLGIPQPNGCTGNPISEAYKNK
ncbi:alkaline phosphatase PafA [Riemerella columbina]|uniref:alkaline phosphatase PafA n=1 Tax=Riemerella columbina TaxID=103810 RepID=UPI00037A2B60|nr:alkaline phosphatase PafA [Riemerella columbina]